MEQPHGSAGAGGRRAAAHQPRCACLGSLRQSCLVGQWATRDQSAARVHPDASSVGPTWGHPPAYQHACHPVCIWLAVVISEQHHPSAHPGRQLQPNVAGGSKALVGGQAVDGQQWLVADWGCACRKVSVARERNILRWMPCAGWQHHCSIPAAGMRSPCTSASKSATCTGLQSSTTTTAAGASCCPNSTPCTSRCSRAAW